MVGVAVPQIMTDKLEGGSLALLQRSEKSRKRLNSKAFPHASSPSKARGLAPASLHSIYDYVHIVPRGGLQVVQAM